MLRNDLGAIKLKFFVREREIILRECFYLISPDEIEFKGEKQCGR